MKHTLHLAAAFAALALAACSADDAETPAPDVPDTPEPTAPYTITATIADPAESRVAMQDDGTALRLTWKEGDKIYVVNSAEGGTSSDGKLYTFTASNVSADGKSALFTAPDNYPAGETPAYAAYQHGTSKLYDLLPRNQYHSAYKFSGNDLPADFFVYGRYDAASDRLVFHHLLSVLKLKITLPADVSGRITKLHLIADENLFYTNKYDLTAEPAGRTDSKLAPQNQYTGNVAVTPGSETTLYLPIAPGTELTGKTFRIYVQTATNLYYSATVRGAGLVAGRCYPLTLPAARWSGGAFYESGTGTASDPYVVRTEAHLRALANTVRANNLSGKYFRLAEDVAITSSAADPWQPIGTFGHAFGGNFDGNGKTVSGTLYLSDEGATAEMHLGLFGETTGTVSDLTVRGDVIYRGSAAQSVYVGGIVGNAGKAVTGCHHIGSLTAENAATTVVYAGGIAATAAQQIDGCTQTGGTITVDAPKAKQIYVGGIAGSLSTEMHTCRNESDLVITSKTDYAGALAGDNGGKIYDCSTFPATLTVTVGGTPQNPVKPIGGTVNTDLTPCTQVH